MPRHPRAGFTLLEVLVALALGSLVFASVAATIDAVADLERRTATRAREDRTAQILLARIGRELTSASRLGDTEALRIRDHGLVDELSVWTLAYGPPRRVSYRWTGNRLDRIDEDPTSTDPASVSDVPDVTVLDIHCQSENGRVAAWEGGGLPASVSIELRIAGRTYGTIVPL